MSNAEFHDSLNPAPLNTILVGSRVLIFDEVDSTNNRALQLGGDGVVLVAERQSAGRGRHGRSWVSDRGLGLWFSVVFDSSVDRNLGEGAQTLSALPSAAALAVRDGLGPECPLSPKWPNDLLLNGKKVCGILVENRGARTVAGIGLNVHHRREDFPPHLRDYATSLQLETGRNFCRRELLRRILEALDKRVLTLREGRSATVFEEWVEACAIKGRTVYWKGTRGVVKEVETGGALIVETPGGLHRIAFGETIELERDSGDAARDRRGQFAYGAGTV